MRSFALVTLVLAFLGSDLPAQEGPSSARSLRIEAARRFLASRDEASLQSFLEEQLATELRESRGEDELRERLRNVRDECRGARLRGVLPSGPLSAELIFESGGVERRVSLELEPTDPHRILILGRLGAPEWAEGMSDEEIVDALDQYVLARVARDQFSGSILLARGDEVLYQQAFGRASRRFDVPNRVDTKFNLGSMNKMFTGVAIAQLVEAGELDFEDTVGDHLPDYPNRDVAENVSLHHLLTHTSGMGSYWNQRYEEAFKSLRSVDALIATFVDDPLSFRPGERFQYSNAGPVVLGKIIEVVSGLSYDDYVEEHIHAACGMTSTRCYEMDVPVPNLAIGYTRSSWDGRPADGWRNNYFQHSVKGGPAGGGFSTVQDLFAFSRALQAGELVSPEMVETLITGKVDLGPGHRYGYLFGDHEEGPRYHGHNGGAPGINGELSFYPELGYTVVVLSNQDVGASPVASFARKMIRAAAAKG